MADYINNKEFYQMLIDYKDKCRLAEENDESVPRIPDCIGHCYLQIANRLATRPNFSGYTYRDEMILDAIENCIVATHSFDPKKSSNPFAYFTQITWFAFLRRIEKEKKQTYVKYKSYENFVVESSLNDEHDAYASVDITNEKMGPILEKYDKKKRKPKKVASNLEKFEDSE